MNTAPFTIGERLKLPATGSWPESHHLFDEDGVHAIRTAIAAERPLLIRGEPGTGKSQLARAAAVKLGRAFITTVVHGRSEPQDLQWRFDAVARLGEAQALAAAGVIKPGDVATALDPQQFLSPGPLWWAFNWEGARQQHAHCQHADTAPESPNGWQPQQGTVLLIDEIDKAEADLPNGLLETLGNGGFSVPYCGQTVRQSADAKPPLVVITTNEERELPAAFLRRCLVLHLAVPEQAAEFSDWLLQRARAHGELDYFEPVWSAAASQLWRDREAAGQQGVSPPGLAEYIDLLRALTRLAPRDEAEQLRLLDKIARFAFAKRPPG